MLVRLNFYQIAAFFQIFYDCFSCSIAIHTCIFAAFFVDAAVIGHNIDVSDVSFTGTKTEPGTEQNKFEVKRINDASQNDVTKNYAVTYVYGTLTVTNEIVVDLACSDGEALGSNGRTKVYDGTPFNISCIVKAKATDDSALTGYTVELLPTIVNVTYPDPKTITEDDITIKYDGSKLDKNKLNITVDGIKCYQITRREITLKANDVVNYVKSGIEGTLQTAEEGTIITNK